MQGEERGRCSLSPSFTPKAKSRLETQVLPHLPTPAQPGGCPRSRHLSIPAGGVQTSLPAGEELLLTNNEQHQSFPRFQQFPPISQQGQEWKHCAGGCRRCAFPQETSVSSQITLTHCSTNSPRPEESVMFEGLSPRRKTWPGLDGKLVFQVIATATRYSISTLIPYATRWKI